MKKRYFSLFLLIFTCLFLFACANEEANETVITTIAEKEDIPMKNPDMYEGFEQGIFVASDGTVLPYRYFLPTDYDFGEREYPVFLYMHGNGSRGTDNKSHLGADTINNAIYQSNYDCIMIAPQCPKESEWTLNASIGDVNTYPGSPAYAEFLESGEPYGSKYFCAAAELLDKFIKDYRVDTSRIYLGGSSNGAGAVWNFMALYPEVFAAGIPVAGSRATADAVYSIAHRYKNTAIWAFHGDKDGTVPVQGTRTLANAIKEIGGNIIYTEVSGATHGTIWKIAAETEGIVDWLFAQSNNSFKNTLSNEKGAPLATPTNLVWGESDVTWDAVDNAGAYKVTLYIDGKAVKVYYTSTNSFTPKISYRDGLEYGISVRAFPSTNEYSIGGESEVLIRQ